MERRAGKPHFPPFCVILEVISIAKTDFFERQLSYDGREKDYSTKRSREKRARRRR
jgi:hypothetical protein